MENNCRHSGGEGCHCRRNRAYGAVIESGRLFAHRSEVQILHEGEIYRLRITRNGKLILNK